MNPVYGNIVLNQGDGPPSGPFGSAPTLSNSVFRCEKIDVSFVGLSNYELFEGLPIEGPPYIYPNPCVLSDLLELSDLSSLYKTIDLLGREVKHRNGFILDMYYDGSVKKKYVID